MSRLGSGRETPLAARRRHNDVFRTALMAMIRSVLIAAEIVPSVARVVRVAVIGGREPGIESDPRRSGSFDFQQPRTQPSVVYPVLGQAQFGALFDRPSVLEFRAVDTLQIHAGRQVDEPVVVRRIDVEFDVARPRRGNEDLVWRHGPQRRRIEGLRPRPLATIAEIQERGVISLRASHAVIARPQRL